MRVVLTVAALLAVSCTPSEREAGLRVVVTLEAGLSSKCMQLEIGAGSTRLSSDSTPLAGKAKVHVGIAQGTLPARVELRAVGFVDDECLVRASEESTLTSATFVKGAVEEVALTLKKVTPKTETNCEDGVDDDLDGQLDCGDSDCDDKPCTSLAACLVATRCTNGSCGLGAMRTCLSPPNTCFRPMGACSPADGGCEYSVAMNAQCDDLDVCTTQDACEADGGCSGVPVSCTQSSNACLEPTGGCTDGGCTFAPRVDAGCDDLDACTVSDRCSGQGACVGSRVTCEPTLCRAFTNQCTADGGCVFAMVDAGTSCDGGVCSLAGDCLPRFPYPPTNFEVVQLRAPPPAPTVLDCGETIIDTAGTGLPRTTNWCRNQPFEASIIKQDGGPDAVLVSLSGLTISPDAGLTLLGDKPVIFAVLGDVDLTGQLVARSGAATCTVGLGRDGSSSLGSNSGGSGAGLSTAGGNGGEGLSGAISGPMGGAIEPNFTASPLRGGCPGGRGGNQSGSPAPGGGGVQILSLIHISEPT
ncbi:MAG: hypothetical protein IAE78_20005, partial [Myxococcus sp.]|nr:hypothetical protein [Myxococcus sp.]